MKESAGLFQVSTPNSSNRNDDLYRGGAPPVEEIDEDKKSASQDYRLMKLLYLDVLDRLSDD
jgi:hypothetical protein